MSDVSTVQWRRVTRSGTWWARLGECAAWRADRQAADGLGGKPGRVLPFLDGTLPDALW